MKSLNSEFTTQTLNLWCVTIVMIEGLLNPLS